MSAMHVYGVVRARHAITSVESADVPDLRIVWDADIGALVSPAGAVPARPNKRALTSHVRVLQEAMAWATVLPMRFGVVMPSDEVVREALLRARRDELVGLLDAFEGRVEVSVKAFYEDEVVLREIVRENDRIARLNETVRGLPEDAGYYDRIRLGELLVEAVKEKRDRDARRIVAALVPHAVEVSVDETFVERVALRAAFLVEERQLETFDGVVDGISREQAGRLRFKYVGPLPPHSFVNLSLRESDRSAA